MKPTEIERIVRKDLKTQLISYMDKSKGADHKIYILNTGKGTFALREPKESIARRIISQDYSMNAWHRIGIPVPKPIIKTKTYIIEDYIGGKDLQEAKLDCNTKKEIMEDLGRIVRQMSRIKTKGYGYIIEPGKGEYKTWKEYCHKNFYRIIDKLKGLYSQKERAAFKKIYDKHPQFMQDMTPSLLHMDLGPQNIIIKNGKINGIIDAGDVISGDPTYELACLHQTYRARRLSGAILKGYGKVNMQKLNFYALYQSLWWVLYFSKIKKGDHHKRVQTERSNVEYYLKKLK